MARKPSIVNSSLLALAIFVFCLVICDAELAESRERREREESEEASITSGIRALEKIRRQIIDSRKARVLPSIGTPETSGYSRYSGPATMDENNLPSRSTGATRHPRRQVDLAMYEALTKLANVQVADPNIDHSAMDGSYVDEINGRGASQSAFYDRTGQGMNKQFKNIDQRNVKNEGSIARTSIPTSGDASFGPRKFNCGPIQDIYIPKVDKRMPAYLCMLGKRAFVISSERFHEENRNQFEVSVDEATFRRLNPLNSEAATLTSGVSVLPATLVLKPGENGYTVRQLDEVQGTSNI